MELKRLTRKMRYLMYMDGRYDPADRDRITEFTEAAWKIVEVEG